MHRTVRHISATILIVALLFTMAGCKGAISSEDTSAPSDATTEVNSYLLLDTELKEFNAVYNLYMRTHSSEMDVKRGTGKTPNGEECTFSYTKTEMYKSLTLMRELSDKTIVDEYFKLDDGALFLARSTAFKNGTFGPVEKYIVRSGKLFSLNTTDLKVDTLADLETDGETKVMADHDMFLHFEDIEYVYEQ